MGERLVSTYTTRGLAQRSRLPLSRVKRGLKLLRIWLRSRPGFYEIRPKTVVRQLKLGHGAAVDIGYALRFWENQGYAIKVRNSPAAYLATAKLVLVLEIHGCLERKDCDSGTACGLIGTRECPFLVGYGGDSIDGDS